MENLLIIINFVLSIFITIILIKIHKWITKNNPDDDVYEGDYAVVVILLDLVYSFVIADIFLKMISLFV